ncbi:Uncharacterised protein g6959 [Pycnogonum litorale]
MPPIVLQPPEGFYFTNSNAWTTWKNRFMRFRLATKLQKDTGETQVNSLIYCMGTEAEHIFTTFNLNDRESTTFDLVLQKFDTYFTPKRNIIAKRLKFECRNQHSGESGETYIRSLFTQAEICNFGSFKEERIRDRLIAGMTDKKLSKRIQLQALKPI